MAASYGGLMPALFLPLPDAVVAAAIRLSDDGSLYRHIWASLQVVLIGFALPSPAAAPLGLLNASYTLGASRRDVLLHVLGPAALPGVLDVLRVTMGWAWTLSGRRRTGRGFQRAWLYVHAGIARLPG